MEKFCPKCGKGYGHEHEFCETDGEKLVMINEEPSLIGRVLEGKYKLTEVVGQGGMGTVYLGYQSSMERHVAVKVLKRKFAQEKVAIKRFLREARAASKLSQAQGRLKMIPSTSNQNSKSVPLTICSTRTDWKLA